MCRGTLVCRKVFRCVANFYKQLPLRLGKVSHRPSSLTVSCSMRRVLFSCACILIGQVFICRYISKATRSFVTAFREAVFCGVPSQVWQIRVGHRYKRSRHSVINQQFHLDHIFHSFFLYILVYLPLCSVSVILIFSFPFPFLLLLLFHYFP
jgi:hypothetical protein